MRKKKMEFELHLFLYSKSNLYSKSESFSYGRIDNLPVYDIQPH
jgi:hypothetical protein